MKTCFLLFVLFTISNVALGEQLIPSRLDPKLGEDRERAFTPWNDPEQNAATWHTLASSNVPIYNERKPGGFSREIYIPNPGIGYWVLGGLSEKALWDTEREKPKIGDELVSASVYENENGAKEYWALWAPRKRAYLLKDKMHELGIAPAQVDIDRSEPFSGAIAFHRTDGHISYELTITNGKVSGVQRINTAETTIAQVVGGWFDLRTSNLSVLIQGGDTIDLKWRAQAQQFHVSLSSKTVTLEHMLYGEGLTLENSDILAAHVLDALDKTEHLVK